MIKNKNRVAKVMDVRWQPEPSDVNYAIQMGFTTQQIQTIAKEFVDRYSNLNEEKLKERYKELDCDMERLKEHYNELDWYSTWRTFVYQTWGWRNQNEQNQRNEHPNPTPDFQMMIDTLLYARQNDRGRTLPVLQEISPIGYHNCELLCDMKLLKQSKENDSEFRITINGYKFLRKYDFFKANGIDSVVIKLLQEEGWSSIVDAVDYLFELHIDNILEVMRSNLQL